MPQLFQVLKCYKCLVFQVHQTKKSNKWECKLCGEKQSIKRHYGIGSGKECRLHVQKLNGIRGEINDLNESIEISKNSDEELEMEHSIPKLETSTHITNITKSKWSNFVDKMELGVQESNNNSSMYLGNTEVVLEIPAKKRRKFKTPMAIHQPTATSCNYINEPAEVNEPQYQQLIYDCDIRESNTKTLSKFNSFKPTTISKRETPAIKNHLDTPKPEIYVLNDLSEENANNPNMQEANSMKTYVPPIVNKHSKWAQFTDESDENKNDVSISTENSHSSTNVPNNLFTLCDENELDDVLNF